MEEIELNELLALCSNNPKLFDFVLKIINREKKAGLLDDLCAYTSTGWDWDVEDIEDFGDIEEDEDIDRWIFAQYNIDEAMTWPDEDAWELRQLEMEFCKYFRNFNWDDITLDNGDLLFLIDNEDYLSFVMYSKDKMINGAVDGIKWGMDFLYRPSI